VFLEGQASKLKKDEVTLPVYSMGSVDVDGKSTLYRGEIRVVSPSGEEFARARPEEITSLIDYYIEDGGKARFPFLKDVGWKGFVPGEESGVYQVGPLARLNACTGMPTPNAQEALEGLWESHGDPPVHKSSALLWGYIVELIQAAELLVLAIEELEPGEEGLRSPLGKPGEGIGVIESPTGILIHRYIVDPQGLIEDAEILLPEAANIVAINTALNQALEDNISDGTSLEKNKGLVLDQVEGILHSYQPNLSPEETVPFQVTLQNRGGEIIEKWRRP
jgi:F420-non-reducing hydrogenase large subunit